MCSRFTDPFGTISSGQPSPISNTRPEAPLWRRRRREISRNPRGIETR